MSKKLEKKQLDKVAGGGYWNGSGPQFYCNHCQKSYFKDSCNKQTISRDCHDIVQYQCPDCGDWIDD